MCTPNAFVVYVAPDVRLTHHGVAGIKVDFQALIGGNKQASVVRRALQRYSYRILALSTVVDEAERRVAAMDIYEDARQLPSTTVQACFQAEDLILNGPLYEGSTLTLCFVELAAHVLKPLGEDEYLRLKALKEAAAGSRHANVVDFELRVSSSTAANQYFMLMPRLTTSLEHFPWLKPAHAEVLVTHMKDGLSYLHSLGFAHSDVKPANVCLHEPGVFVLIDLGSAGRFGARARSTLPYVPMDLCASTLLASPVLDVWMLGAMLAEKCCARRKCLDIGGKMAPTITLREHLHAHLPPPVFDLWMGSFPTGLG